MAGPGDNTRNKPGKGGDTDAFKRAVSVCMRALAGDGELEVAFAKEKPALAGARARLEPVHPAALDALLVGRRNAGGELPVRQIRRRDGKVQLCRVLTTIC